MTSSNEKWTWTRFWQTVREFFKFYWDMVPKSWKTSALKTLERIHGWFTGSGFRNLRGGVGQQFKTFFALLLVYMGNSLSLVLEITLVILAIYFRFWQMLPPVLPLIPDGFWWPGLLSLAYISVALYTYGFAMQTFGKDKTHGSHPAFYIPFLVIVDGVAFYVGVPGIVMWPLTLVLLTAFFVNDYTMQGKHGIAPLTRFPLMILAIWISGVAEFQDSFNIAVAFKALSTQGWIFMAIVVVFSFGGFFLLGWLRNVAVRRGVQKS